MLSHQSICKILIIGAFSITRSIAFQLSTTSKIKGVSPSELHDFLATPTNWPKIVLSSNSVKEPRNKSNRVDVPLKVGDEVEEVFGLPPLLPLSVVWKCVESSPPPNNNKAGVNNGQKGRLEFYSSSGVPNLARDCSMKFDIESVNGDKNTSVVKMDMEFDLISPLLLIGATPLLKLDNDIALKVLLPNTIRNK